MSEEKQLSLKEDPELERHIHDILDRDIKTLEETDPELFNSLKQSNINRLKRATGRERSNLTKWLLDEAIRKTFTGE
ncbi:MAG: hypothetical protein QG639_324 [Patescibacteria group bacterium]|nr:hypothetical protein [Patescibacteria group bacterium]